MLLEVALTELEPLESEPGNGCSRFPGDEDVMDPVATELSMPRADVDDDDEAEDKAPSEEHPDRIAALNNRPAGERTRFSVLVLARPLESSGFAFTQSLMDLLVLN